MPRTGSIATPTPKPDAEIGTWIEIGTSERRIEVWHVSPEELVRCWCATLPGPGWFWQDMTRTEIHGPFATRDAAVADIGAASPDSAPPSPKDA